MLSLRKVNPSGSHSGLSGPNEISGSPAALDLPTRTWMIRGAGTASFQIIRCSSGANLGKSVNVTMLSAVAAISMDVALPTGMVSSTVGASWSGIGLSVDVGLSSDAVFSMNVVF